MLLPPVCPFCNHRNPSAAKFCNECGSPLHLSPCEACGAINNLGDTHCWQCNGVLRPPRPPDAQANLQHGSGISAPKPPGREQRSTTFEQDHQEPAQNLAAPVLAAPEQASDANPSQARGVERASTASNIPEPSSLFVQADNAPRHRSRGLLAAVLVVAAASMIAAAAYLHMRESTSPEPIASPAPLPEMRADASAAPRIAPEVAAVPTDAPATTHPEREDSQALAEPHVATDAEKDPAGTPARPCPAPVEAMALCKWLVQPGGPQ